MRIEFLIFFAKKHTFNFAETESALCKVDSIIHEKIPDIRPALLRSPVQCVSDGRWRGHPAQFAGRSFCPSSRGQPLLRSGHISFFSSQQFFQFRNFNRVSLMCHGILLLCQGYVVYLHYQDIEKGHSTFGFCRW